MFEEILFPIAKKLEKMQTYILSECLNRELHPTFGMYSAISMQPKG